MSAVDLLAGGVVLFALVPEVTSLGCLARGSPRLLAAAQLAGLLGWAVVPAAVVSCLGDFLARVVAAGRLGAQGCWLGFSSQDWLWVGLLGGLMALVPLGVQAVRTLRAACRTELPALVRRVATERGAVLGGSVWVVPSERRAAYAAGVRRPVAVVTSAVLDPLGPEEQQAVVEHEAAHIRLGHPRLLVLASVIERAYGVLPPVRRRCSALRLALEAAADDEAVRVVGAPAIVRALTQTVLAAGTPGASFGDPEQLVWRLERLTGSPERLRLADVLVAVLTVALVGVFAWVACLSVGGDPVLGGELLCASWVGLIAARPLLSLRRSRRASPHLPSTTNL